MPALPTPDGLLTVLLPPPTATPTGTFENPEIPKSNCLVFDLLCSILGMRISVLNRESDFEHGVLTTNP
jgi:hypothetical protein